MHSARLTVLMPPDQKAQIAKKAARLGISSGEFVRLATEQFDDAEVEAELEALTRELEAAIPTMRASLAAMERSIAESRSAIRECLEQVSESR